MLKPFIFMCLVTVGLSDSSTPIGNDNFIKYDSDRNGALNFTEFLAFWLGEMDTSPKDGKITSREFVSGWHHEHYNDNSHALLFFMEMDIDHNEYINQSDLLKFFSFWDKNEDNNIEYDEFIQVWPALFGDMLNLHDGHHH